MTAAARYQRPSLWIRPPFLRQTHVTEREITRGGGISTGRQKVWRLVRYWYGCPGGRWGCDSQFPALDHLLSPCSYPKENLGQLLAAYLL